MTQRISLVFKIKAIPKARPRFGKNVYTPKRTLDFERSIKQSCIKMAKQIDHELIDGPVKATISFNFQKPGKPSRLYPTKCGDLDNLIKAVLDGVQKSGVIFKDDVQVVELQANKKFSEIDFIQLTIEGVCQL